jgi:adenylate cyclase
VTEQRVQRRLAAILAADVVGYSALMQRAEEATYAEFERLKRELIEPSLSRHEGRLIKTTGDGALAEFASPLAATRCAVEIQDHLASGLSTLTLRIGLNLGDVIVGQDGDLYGDGINIAVRLEGTADPGGILVSEKVYSEVEGKLDVGFEDRGEQQLKNISKPVRAFSVRARADSSPSDRPITAPPLPAKPSIAVLPFQNMSGDPDQEYFADGIVEDIITALSRFKSVFVIARNSSFVYKNRAIDIKQVGRELGVRYVLEGSVRKTGGRVRITGQLIECATGAHLWANKFDGQIGDIFELQDGITQDVVGAIAPRLVRAEIELARRKKPDNWTAYDHYMRGMALSFHRTAQANKDAIAEFRRTLMLDPEFAPAYARIAICIHELQYSFLVPVSKEDRIEAVQMATRAIELDPDDAYILAITSFVFGTFNDEFERGAACAERAVTINPNLSAAWNARGWMNLHLGETEIATESFQHSLRLNPLDPVMVPRVFAGLAAACLFSGKFDDGMRWSGHAIAQQPGNIIALLMLLGNARQAGRKADMENAAARIRTIAPQLRHSSLQSMFFLKKAEHRDLVQDIIGVLGLER